MNRIMITTSSRVASCMTAQGFNIKLRDYRTGRFIPFEVLPSTIDTTGIFSIDETNKDIVERRRKVEHDGYRHVRKNDYAVASNHVIYDRLICYRGHSVTPHLNAYEFAKRRLYFRNCCYELYG